MSDRAAAPLRRALLWLAETQEGDGSWADPVRSGGRSASLWTTGFVASGLDPLARRGDPLARHLLDRSWTFLLTARRGDGGWGLGVGEPADPGATAWCLLSAPKSTDPLDDLLPERRVLARCLEETPEALSPGVGASAALALARLGLCEDEMVVARAAEGLARWWRDATELEELDVERLLELATVAQLFRVVKGAEALPATLGDGLAVRQRASGSWREDPALTALALTALAELDRARWHEALGRGRAWLLDRQGDDGSWRAPWELSWLGRRPAAALRGIVATATVVAALERLKKPPRRRRVVLPRWPRGGDAELRHEVEGVIADFDREVSTLPETLLMVLRTSPVMKARGSGLSHYLPFWLDRSLAGGRLTQEARRMALANRYGQVFCLLRDAVVDRDPKATTSILLPVDALFLRFLRGYQSSFEADHEFWAFFERYWQEYLEAVAREQVRFRRPLAPRDAEDLLWIGRKLSPVKICCAGMALKASRREVIPALEELLETLERGLTLMDSVADWESDLASGLWGWPLAQAAQELTSGQGAPRPLNADEIERVLIRSSIVAEVLEASARHLGECVEASRVLGLEELRQWAAAFRDDVARTAQRARAAMDGRAQGLPLKRLRGRQGPLVLHEQTLELFGVEPEVTDLLERIEDGGEPAAGSDEEAILRELVGESPHPGGPSPEASGSDPARALASPWQIWLVDAPGPGPEASPDDLISRSLELLSPSTPADRRARHLVIRASGQAPGFGLSARAARLAGEDARSRGMPLRVHVVAPFDAADLPELASLRGELSSVLLYGEVETAADLSRIGRAIESFRSSGFEAVGGEVELVGEGVDPIVAAEAMGTAGASLVVARRRASIVSLARQEFSRLVEWFERTIRSGDLLFPVDVLEPMLQLFERRRRPAHCGAGLSRLAVTRDGTIWPCDRAVAWPILSIGSVLESPPRVDSDPFIQAALRPSFECQSCWSRSLCGGGCRVEALRRHGDPSRPAVEGCREILHRYELIADLMSSLGPDFPKVIDQLDTDRLVPFSKATCC